VKLWTVHHRPGAPAVLVREAFSWPAAVFGPLWLLAGGALLWGSAALVVELAVARLCGQGVLLGVALAPFWGFWGQDLRRLRLARDGFRLVGVVSGESAETALLRLFERAPELAREEGA
jgi:hypothetical protein